MVFAIVFSIKLKTAEDDAAFITAFKALSDHVRNAEPGALTYEIYPHVDEGCTVPYAYVVLERYATQIDVDAHGGSPAFQAFIATVTSLRGVESMNLQHCADNAALTSRMHAIPAGPPAVRDPALEPGVLVFGGARHGNDPVFTQEARALGEYLANTSHAPLVYGGGTVGIMGEVAQTVKQHGGRVISVIPEALRPRETSGEMIGDLIYFTTTMSERKSIMFAFAHTVVALPGGVGTLDELLEVITLFQLNAYCPKIGIVNTKGFYDPFLATLRHLVSTGFLEESTLSAIVVDDTAAGVMEKMAHRLPPASPCGTLVWNHRP